jgi:hypothetical protein
VPGRLLSNDLLRKLYNYARRARKWLSPAPDPSAFEHPSLGYLRWHRGAWRTTLVTRDSRPTALVFTGSRQPPSSANLATAGQLPELLKGWYAEILRELQEHYFADDEDPDPARDNSACSAVRSATLEFV